jgi:hypothetical protein
MVVAGIAGIAAGAGIGIAALFAFASAGYAPGVAPEAIGTLIWPVLGIVFGIFGNRWRGVSLASRGFAVQDTVDAGSPHEAVDIYAKKLSGVQRG